MKEAAVGMIEWTTKRSFAKWMKHYKKEMLDAQYMWKWLPQKFGRYKRWVKKIKSKPIKVSQED